MKNTPFASLCNLGLFFLLGSTGCSKDTLDSGLSTDLTWADDIAPILYDACLGCHLGDSVQKMEGIGHFPLTTHSDAESVAIYLQQVVLSERMPPWPGGAICDQRPDFLDDPSLSTDERLLILEWTESDLAPGNLEMAPPLPSEKTLLGQTHALFPAEPIEPSPDKDGYPCELLDPQLSQDHWMTGLQGLVDNRALLASITAWVVPPDRLEEAQLLGSECFGLAPLPNLDLLGFWSPGATPFETPVGSGIAIPSDSQILIRLQHHVWQSDGLQADQSGLGLRLTTTPPNQIAQIFAIGNAESGPELQVQGNETNAEFLVLANKTHQEEMRFNPESTQAGSEIWAVGGWMHWAGKEMSISLDGTDSECLLNLEDWQPDWMRFYRYDPSTEFPKWDPQSELHLRCTYENTSHNADLMGMLNQENVTEIQDRRLGPGLQDESCLAFIGTLQPNL